VIALGSHYVTIRPLYIKPNPITSTPEGSSLAPCACACCPTVTDTTHHPSAWAWTSRRVQLAAGYSRYSHTPDPGPGAGPRGGGGARGERRERPHAHPAASIVLYYIDTRKGRPHTHRRLLLELLERTALRHEQLLSLSPWLLAAISISVPRFPRAQNLIRQER
jgi:hypothetical protein